MAFAFGKVAPRNKRRHTVPATPVKAVWDGSLGMRPRRNECNVECLCSPVELYICIAARRNTRQHAFKAAWV